MESLYVEERERREKKQQEVEKAEISEKKIIFLKEVEQKGVRERNSF